MRATVLDLRYRMKEELRAHEKGERVSVYCHGRLKGTIIPTSVVSTLRVKDHPSFGMALAESQSVSEQMDEFRKGRLDAI